MCVVVGSMTAAFLGKMTFTEAGVFIGSVGTFFAGVGLRFAADAKKEDTENG